MSELKAEIPPCVLVIFGASGDLTQRKLIPALHSLHCDGLLPKNLQILGAARTEYSDEVFRQRMLAGVEKHGRFEAEMWPAFAERLYYMPGSYDEPDTFRQLAERLVQFDKKSGTSGNRFFYLAIPPFLYSDVIRSLGEAGLNRSANGWARILVEKPFGHDLESARQLNAEVQAYFSEEQIFRIDHYLGKETVQNILAFRFANFIFQEIW